MAMSVHEFRDDDAGYLAWRTSHPHGHVINILRGLSTATARLHRAGCRTIGGQNPRGGAWTGLYIKVCAEQLADLEQWAIDLAGSPIPRCGVCHPERHVGQPVVREQPMPTAKGRVLEGRYEVCGRPGTAVEAWADDYIRFERRPAWQEQLRTEIRTRCQQLQPSSDQVLHATFFGPKRPNADVENIALYYIDSFAIPGSNGIRFEHGADVPPTPGGADYPFCYRYELAPMSGDFGHWQQGRTLASFDWTSLGAFAGHKQAAQVWLALARGHVEVAQPACAPGTPFAVRLEVRPPHGRRPVLGNLVKGTLDGVICAFQAHTDTTVLPEAVARIAAALPADSEEIEQHLLDQRRAVLGVVQRLVYPYRKDVKWGPSDHLCVASELLLAEPVDDHWAIRGGLVELSR